MDRYNSDFIFAEDLSEDELIEQVATLMAKTLRPDEREYDIRVLADYSSPTPVKEAWELKQMAAERAEEIRSEG
jgi:hypothetical protein